ncbi:hypothetical protein [Pseudomonas brassicacearum]|uniref:hypothetical protein n=1 Tax=Pseudomonas brassicacearum TaxID=930166 RepID=UPI001E2F5437|nr:hypothetical protein [Pseudomonas brassicacearum]
MNDIERRIAQYSGCALRHSDVNVRFWPILLKKSTTVPTAEKYAPEIEIFILSIGFRAQISRSWAQERRFQQSVRGQPGKPTFSTQSADCCLLQWLRSAKSRHPR